MFVVVLKLSDNKANAKEHMQGHNAWIKKGFDDGVFVLAGLIEPGKGGSVFAHNTTYEALEKRVSEDPFVSENVVSAEILEISPKRVDDRLNFLMS